MIRRQNVEKRFLQNYENVKVSTARLKQRYCPFDSHNTATSFQF